MIPPDTPGAKSFKFQSSSIQSGWNVRRVPSPHHCYQKQLRCL